MPRDLFLIFFFTSWYFIIWYLPKALSTCFFNGGIEKKKRQSQWSIWLTLCQSVCMTKHFQARPTLQKRKRKKGKPLNFIDQHQDFNQSNRISCFIYLMVLIANTVRLSPCCLTLLICVHTRSTIRRYYPSMTSNEIKRSRPVCVQDHILFNLWYQ